MTAEKGLKWGCIRVNPHRCRFSDRKTLPREFIAVYLHFLSLHGLVIMFPEGVGVAGMVTGKGGLLAFQIRDALIALDRHGIQYEFVGDADTQLHHPASIDELQSHSLGFYVGDDPTSFTSLFNQTNLVILKTECRRYLPKANFLFVENPLFCFCIVARLFIPPPQKSIHPTAHIVSGAQIAGDASIGAYSYVDADCVIEDDVVIGENCVLKSAIVKRGTRISSGVKIGLSGLGAFRDGLGGWYDFPHFGGVIIDENVVINTNAVIDRGTLNNTIIGPHTRVGTLCLIAHGVQISEGSLLSHGVTIGGGTSIGRSVTIWLGASVRNGITIGDFATVGMGATLLQNVPEGETWVGNPAKPINRQTHG